MIPLPWSNVESWNCTACGFCCKGYSVVLGFNEWIKIVRMYGVGVTEPGISKFYLRRRDDNTCLFLYNLFNRGFCGMQDTKPRACKLWPFKIHDKPKYGRPNKAHYTYGEKKLFVYVDPSCPGIQWGTPTQKFTYRIVPEFVEIALGLREKQYFSTSKISYHPMNLRPKERKIR